jgi:hypothetical protein
VLQVLAFNGDAMSAVCAYVLVVRTLVSLLGSGAVINSGACAACAADGV